MAIDTSALERFKREREQTQEKKTGSYTDINIGAFGYEWNNKVEAPQPYKKDEPKGILLPLLKSTRGIGRKFLSDYQKREESIRQDMSTAEEFKRTFVEQPREILTFLGQGLGASLLGLGKSMQEEMLTPFVGREEARAKTKSKAGSLSEKITRTLAGEDLMTYQEITEQVRTALEASPDAKDWEKKNLPWILGVGLFAADAWPGKPSPKKEVVSIITDLIEETTEKGAKERLIRAGIEEAVATRIARRIPAATDEAAVRRVIVEETANEIEQVIKAADVPTGVVSKATGEEYPLGQAPKVTQPERVMTENVRREALSPDEVARITDIEQKAVELTRRNGGVTINLNGDVPTGGYAYSPFKNVETVIPEADFNEQQLDNFVEKFYDQLVADDKNHVGVWVEDGNVYMDISKVIDDEQEAVVDSLKNNQIALFDLNTFETKYTNDYEKIGNTYQYKRKIEGADKAGVEATTQKQKPVPDEKASIETTNGKKVDTYGDLPPEGKVDLTPEDVRPIKEVVRQESTALRATQATGKKTGRNLAKEMEANINRMNEKIPDDEIVRIREQNLLGQESIDEIILRKRGIITDAEAIERAKKIQGTLDDIVNLPKGTVLTKEQYTAVRQIVAQEEEINKALRQMLDEGGIGSSPAERSAVKRLNEGYENLPEEELLVRALEESTAKLKKAQIVEMAARSEAGRSLQALKQYVGAVDNRLRVLYRAINNSKKLNAQEKQAMLETITRLDTADDKVFIQTLTDLAQPDFFDKVAEWSVAAKLWNPTTHVVNFGGNTARAVTDMGIKAVVDPKAAPADFAGAVVGFKRGLKNALKALSDEGYAAQLSKYAETGGHIPAIGGRLGKTVRTPFRLLGAGDEIFRNMAYQRKLYRDAYHTAKKEGLTGDQLNRRMEELLNTPTIDMMRDATDEAKHLTFQDDMGEIIKQIDRLRDPSTKKTMVGKGTAVGIRMFLPFLKTPTNLFKQSIDFSPLGVAKNYTKLKTAIKAGDRETAGTIIGEAMLGTAIAAYIAMETMDGNVTGGAPRDKGAKDRFYRENKLPYAIKIGDTWYQYKRVDPFASVVGLTADMVQLDEKNAGALLGVVAENLKDKTYLSGVSDLMNVLTGEEWERDYALKSMLLGAAMPSFVGHITRSIDSNVRVADTIGQRLLVQTPGMSESYPSRVNVLGYSVERANKGLNYFFNPIQTETASIDPVSQSLMEIDKTISVPNDRFSRDGVEYKLTPTEYEDFARFTGIKLRFELMKLFRENKYKSASIDEKSAMIDTLRRDIQTEWKDAFVVEKNNISPSQQVKNVFAGRERYAQPEPDAAEKIKNYFLGQ